ncbi:MAG TPA: hypothetical protein VD970_01980 [Acetobacteraceae bacterium]|nr:hypothetical protein [Acetobacteraceae bacterium]
MTLAEILAQLSYAHGRRVESAEYPTLTALLDDWRRKCWRRR